VKSVICGQKFRADDDDDNDEDDNNEVVTVAQIL
jgi:hypothetical protein